MMLIQNRVFAVMAVLVMGISFAPLQAKAATFDIGTINFGGAPLFGLIGSGTLTGTFDFDNTTKLFSNANFVASGTTSSASPFDVDGTYNSIAGSAGTAQQVPFVTTTFTVFRGAESTPTAALSFSITQVSADPSFSFAAAVGRCLGDQGFGQTGGCGTFVRENTSTAGTSQQGPGDFDLGTVPLPAPILMLLGALGVFGSLAVRRRAVPA